jgi:TLD
MITYRFLWKAHGDGVRVFKWTGKNDYVALCEPESISFGGGCVPTCFVLYGVFAFPFAYCFGRCRFFHRDGHYGLYLDETLYEGSSARCPTFDNDPLCASEPRQAGGTATFECVGLEVWGVGPS